MSNNSAAAINAYLTAHNLAAYVTLIVGRAYADPGRMKPDPGPLIDAVRALGAEPKPCVLVGDSLSDIEAARASGVAAIGFTNRPWKVRAFGTADVVITSMRDIRGTLSPVPPGRPMKIDLHIPRGSTPISR